MEQKEIVKLLSNILEDDEEIFSILFRLSGGMMNESYVFSYKDNKYIIYLPFGNANDLVNRDLEKKSQKICFDLGITSENIYFDTKTGIKINRFLEGNSLDKVDDFNLKEVAKLFKKLHQSPTLVDVDYNPLDRLVGYENDRIKLTDYIDDKYQEMRDYLFSNKDFLKENEVKVLSHNDAQKSNIIKDDKGDYYFIDFEFMANNDEIYDIAAYGNGLVSEGYDLLSLYFEKLDEIKIKKYFLYRLYISLQWYNVAISKHFNNEGAMHGYDFMQVAKHFFDNAYECYFNLTK